MGAEEAATAVVITTKLFFCGTFPSARVLGADFSGVSVSGMAASMLADEICSRAGLVEYLASLRQECLDNAKILVRFDKKDNIYINKGFSFFLYAPRRDKR